MCVGGGKIHERRPMAPWPRAGLTMPRSPATGRAGAEWNRTLKRRDRFLEQVRVGGGRADRGAHAHAWGVTGRVERRDRSSCRSWGGA